MVIGGDYEEDSPSAFNQHSVRMALEDAATAPNRLYASLERAT